MTILFIDSFDHYSRILDKWSFVNPSVGPFNTNITGGRHSSGCLEFTSNKHSIGRTIIPRKEIIAGFALKLVILGGGDDNIIRFLNDDTEQVSLEIDAGTGELLFKRGGTLLERSSKRMRTGVWYYIETKVNIDNSSGSYEVRVNNETWLSATGVDTQVDTLDEIDEIRLGSVNNDGLDNALLDDFYISDTSGVLNNDFLGDISISALFPSGNGFVNQLTGSDGNSVDNYLLVNENPPDSGISYVTSSTSGETDLYEVEDLPSAPSGESGIFGIQVSALSQKTTAGLRIAHNVIRTSGINYDGVDYYPSLDGYDFYYDAWQEHPYTAGVWTLDAINNIQIGTSVAQ
jgi:hypothetical protein